MCTRWPPKHPDDATRAWATQRGPRSRHKHKDFGPDTRSWCNAPLVKLRITLRRYRITIREDGVLGR